MKNTKLKLKMLLAEEDNELELGSEETPAGDDGDVPEDADDEAVDDEGDTATDEEVDVTPAEETELRKPLEAQVDAVLADYELAALKSAKVNENLSLKMLLSEVEEPVEFDIQTFASDVARLIDNYETLLDIESAIYYRALAIVEKNYGSEFADAFKQIMNDRYRFDFGDVRVDPIKNSAPLALGAGGEGGGA